MLKYAESKVLNEALPDTDTFKAVLGILGLAGGIQVNSDASIASVQGDFTVLAQAGIETGSYQFRLPNNTKPQIKGIAAFQVGGFTPRDAQTAETCEARVTGYNTDANGWYVSVQIATISTGAINPTPPSGFVIGLMLQATY